MVLNAIIVLPGLTKRSIWLDESTTIFFSHQTWSKIISETRNDVHPPLYYFFMSIWITLFGDSEVSVRIISWFFGELILIVLYWWLKKRFSERKTLLIILLLAINPFYVQYQQEARMYTLLPLMLLIVYVQLDLYIKANITYKSIILLIISNTVALYIHNYALISLFVIYLVFFANRFYFGSLKNLSGEDWKKLLLMFFGIFLLYIPWLLSLFQQIGGNGVGGAIPEVTLRNGYVFIMRMIFLTGEIRYAFIPIIYFSLLTIIGCILIVLNGKMSHDDNFIVELILIAGLNFAIPYSISFTKFPLGYSIFNYRFILFSVVLFKIVMVNLFEKIYHLISNVETKIYQNPHHLPLKLGFLQKLSISKIFAGITVVLLIVPTFQALTASTFYQSNGDYRKAVHFVESESNQVIPVLIESGITIHAFAYYFNYTWDNALVAINYNKNRVITHLNETKSNLIDYRQFDFNSNTLPAILTILNQSKTVWYFISHSRDSSNIILNYMINNNLVDKSIGILHFDEITLFRATILTN